MSSVTQFVTTAGNFGQTLIDDGRGLIQDASNRELSQVELLELTTEAANLQAMGNMLMGSGKKQNDSESAFIEQLGR